MILDDGICTVFLKQNTAAAGHMPVFSFTPIYKSWYKKLDFTSAPRYLSEMREYSQLSLKIRVLRCEQITNHAIVVLRDTDTVAGTDVQYEVIRCYHDRDPETVDPITDIDLTKVDP